MKAKGEEKRQAIQMRKEGRSVAYISDALKVAKSSVSTWTKGIVSPEEILQRSRMATITSGRQQLAAKAHKARRDREKIEHAEEGKRRAEEGSLLYVMGCMFIGARVIKAAIRFGSRIRIPSLSRFFIDS